jgi:hypothetical protein
LKNPQNVRSLLRSRHAAGPRVRIVFAGRGAHPITGTYGTERELDCRDGVVQHDFELSESVGLVQDAVGSAQTAAYPVVPCR